MKGVFLNSNASYSQFLVLHATIISQIQRQNRHRKKKQSIEIKNSKQLRTQIAKSSEATIKIPEIRLTIKPDISSNGYITTAEGILSKYKKELEEERDSAEDQEDRKKAKNQLKKLWKIELGEIPITLTIEDPSGNSAIIT